MPVSPATSPDLVTPNGSLRFTSTGIKLEAGSSSISIGPAGIEISAPGPVKINGVIVNINNGALEVL